MRSQEISTVVVGTSLLVWLIIVGVGRAVRAGGRARRGWGEGALAGAVGAVLLITGAPSHLDPVTSTARVETPAAPVDPMPGRDEGRLRAGTHVEALATPADSMRAATISETTEPARPLPASVRPKTPPAPVSLTPAPRNEISNFRASSISGREMQVTVDYAYAGDFGKDEIFIHAAALESAEWSSRVPGTSFPEAAVAPGAGSVTINIRKVAEARSSTSTRVMVCMVSLPMRSAFFCKSFEYEKSWD